MGPHSRFRTVAALFAKAADAILELSGRTVWFGPQLERSEHVVAALGQVGTLKLSLNAWVPPDVVERAADPVHHRRVPVVLQKPLAQRFDRPLSDGVRSVHIAGGVVPQETRRSLDRLGRVHLELKHIDDCTDPATLLDLSLVLCTLERDVPEDSAAVAGGGAGSVPRHRLDNRRDPAGVDQSVSVLGVGGEFSKSHHLPLHNIVLVEVVAQAVEDQLDRAFCRLHLSVDVLAQFGHEPRRRFLHVRVFWMRRHRLEHNRPHLIQHLEADFGVVEQVCEGGGAEVLHSHVVRVSSQAIHHLGDNPRLDHQRPHLRVQGEVGDELTRVSNHSPRETVQLKRLLHKSHHRHLSHVVLHGAVPSREAGQRVERRVDQIGQGNVLTGPGQDQLHGVRFGHPCPLDLAPSPDVLERLATIPLHLRHLEVPLHRLCDCLDHIPAVGRRGDGVSIVHHRHFPRFQHLQIRGIRLGAGKLNDGPAGVELAVNVAAVPLHHAGGTVEGPGCNELERRGDVLREPRYQLEPRRQHRGARGEAIGHREDQHRAAVAADLRTDVRGDAELLERLADLAEHPVDVRPGLPEESVEPGQHAVPHKLPPHLWHAPRAVLHHRQHLVQGFPVLRGVLEPPRETLGTTAHRSELLGVEQVARGHRDRTVRSASRRSVPFPVGVQVVQDERGQLRCGKGFRKLLGAGERGDERAGGGEGAGVAEAARDERGEQPDDLRVRNLEEARLARHGVVPNRSKPPGVHIVIPFSQGVTQCLDHV
eukprot:m.59818 g.59818  ORF g.59818 m.59818 type:complete len:761 (+) comp9480_c1_seq1:60-2342(+)